MLFDIGGILVELGGLEIFRSWRGGEISEHEVWRQWLASPAVRAFERGQIEPEAFARLMVSEMSLPVSAEEFLATFSAWPRAAVPGIADLLARLAPGLRRATLSNTNSLHWPRITDEFGIGPLFEHHFPSHETGKIKPDPEAFLHVAETLALPPGRILFLDDVAQNVAAARAAGLQAVHAVGLAEAERRLASFDLLT